MSNGRNPQIFSADRLNERRCAGSPWPHDLSQEPHQAEKESQPGPDDPVQPIGHDREDRPMPERRKTDATAGWIECATATSENSSTK
jgi:hypothetical protein